MRLMRLMRLMNGCMDGWMHGWMDGCMDGCMDGWMDEQNHSERMTKQRKENVVCVCMRREGEGAYLPDPPCAQ